MVTHLLSAYVTNFNKKTYAILVVAILAIHSTACSIVFPDASRIAAAHNFAQTKAEGKGFDHIVFEKLGKASEALHVYLDGDGHPWVLGRFIAKDPTPSNPLALTLMTKTPYSSIFIGRPCYFGLATSDECNPKLWTSERYSIEIVQSIANIVDQYRKGLQPVVIIGHSGGGALAVLVGYTLKGDITVITLAGNLDVEAWTRHHDYLPLTGSLNPIKLRDLTHLNHIHFAGGRDTNILASHIEQFSTRHNGHVVTLPEFDHGCCWISHWPALLEDALQLVQMPIGVFK